MRVASAFSLALLVVAVGLSVWAVTLLAGQPWALMTGAGWALAGAVFLILRAPDV